MSRDSALGLRVVLVLALGLIETAWVSAAGPDWGAAPAESQGFDGGKLEAFKKQLAERGTTSLLVIRHDKVVCEWYAEGWSRTKAHGTASLAKALVGGMSLLLAIDEGKISADDLACKYIPEWKSDPVKSTITIRELATHTSGLEDAEDGDTAHEKLTGWKGDFWKRKPDPFSIAIKQAPVLFKPGTGNAYSNPGMAALGYAITASLRGSAQTDLKQLLAERLMDKMGIPRDEWAIGYNQPSEVDGLKLYATWGGASYSPRAAAAVGRLLMRKGDWDGRRIISAAAVENSLKYAGMPIPARPHDQYAPASGLGIYSNFNRRWEKLPADALAGAGASNQTLLAVPSMDLVVVRFGTSLAEKGETLGFWELEYKYIFAPLMDAVVAKGNVQAEVPHQRAITRSPVIAGIDWAPVATIRRAALGSDNWPLTWADDDAMYTGYGDGNGFEPQIEKKLSMGFAKVEGMAGQFRGINIRTPMEQMGDGKKGRKASGMLMVDGVLYLLARNAGNAQLARSADHGKNWEWAEWKFNESFGCPTFLNFGRNDSGARDEYVYVYSPDVDSAYEMADRVVMARVPKDQIMRREAYEFFVKQDDGGGAKWSSDIAQRGAAFEDTGKCGRGGVTFDAGIKRYLWWMGSQTDGRFKGGFRVLDAPEPWGPWTVAYETGKWDVGPGESGSFPSKWMSADGLEVNLVFSGEDSFAVRKGTVRLGK